MAVGGFFWKRSLGGERDIRRSPLGSGNANGYHGGLPGAVSTTFTHGDALKFANGKLAAAGTTDTVQYICDAPLGSPIVTGATDETCIPVIKVDQSIFSVNFTPLVSLGACQANSSAVTMKLPLTTATTSDLVGGLVYNAASDEVRVITANTYSNNVVTLTVSKPWTVTPTTGHTGSIAAFGYGNNAVQLNGPNAIATTIAGAASGKVGIYSVDMKRGQAEVYFVSGD